MHRLSVKPYTYEQLREETKIQRNRLRRILYFFIDKKIVITHKYNFIENTTWSSDNPKPKTGLNYYVLDLDNKESLRYLIDIDLDNKIKYYSRLNSEKRQSIEKVIKKLNSLEKTKGVEYYLIEYNKALQIFKTVENTDPSFFPYMYSEELFGKKWKKIRENMRNISQILIKKILKSI